MRRGFPSMTALLGVLAIAGYQNREKLAEMVGKRGGGLPDDARTRLGLDASDPNAGGVGSFLRGGLGELVQRFKDSGFSDRVESWVGTGPNREVASGDLEQAIGADVLVDLEQRTGLSRAEILTRLSRDLPRAVDEFTPRGRVPETDDEFPDFAR